MASKEVPIQKLQSEHVLQGRAEVEIGLDYISPAKRRVSMDNPNHWVSGFLLNQPFLGI